MVEIGINSAILTQIIDCRKTVEGRLAKNKFLTLKAGDIISIREDFYKNGSIVESRDDAARIQVVRVKKYDNFRAMLTDVGFAVSIPDATGLEEAVNEYSRYYSKDEEIKHGVLAIFFRVVPF